MRQLKNGAVPLLKIIISLEVNTKVATTVVDRTVVVAKWNDDKFVTWEMDADDNCYWGHYFQDRKAAFIDVAKRAGLIPESATVLEY